MPKLSVIVPVYNSEKYIERCLNSIINQSYKNIEIIVIDDCSTDKSNQIIQSFCEKDKRIKHIRLSKNNGVGYARNVGISNATGKYIGFVDSDDWIDSNMYSCLVNACETNNTKIALCSIVDEYENSILREYRYRYLLDNTINNTFAINLLSRLENQDIYITPIVNNKIYSASLLKDNRIVFPTGIQFEDNVFSFLLLTFECDISIVSIVRYHYYQRKASLFHSLSKQLIDDFFDAFIKLKNELSRRNIYNQFQNSFISFFDRTLTVIVKMVFEVEGNPSIQKEYITYTGKRLFENEDLLKEYINYFDINRIKKYTTR